MKKDSATFGALVAYVKGDRQREAMYPGLKSCDHGVFVPVGPDSVALIDAADAEAVMKHTWHIVNGYAVTKIGRKFVSMPQFLLGKRAGHRIDHMNRVRLDNRRENLRFATPAQNNQNASRRTRNENLPKGVSRGTDGIFKARISSNGKQITLGTFQTSAAAARAYDEAAKTLFGEFASTNESAQDHLLHPVTLANAIR